ncbi:MAG: AAA family ATPase, partial [Bacteroidota bacterium]
MAILKLSIPVLVQNIQTDNGLHYRLRPLFISNPQVNHRRFELAISKFQKEIKHYFAGFILDRSNIDEILWFGFNHELTYKVYSFQLTIGKQFVKGPFGIVHFQLQGLTFICLPAFNNYLFIAQADSQGKVNIFEEAKRAIQHLFRVYKSNLGVETAPEAYFATKGEFVTYVHVNRSIISAQFKFERDQVNWFFSRLNSGTDFDGAVEIDRVGYDLNNRYPAELKRAYYREDLIHRLYQNVYRKENVPIALIGKDGVGKHTVIHEIIWRYLDGRKAKIADISTTKIWHVDPTRIIAGMSVVGWWQKRFEAILSFVRDRIFRNSNKVGPPDKILIDNPVAMLRIGKSSQNSMTLSDVLLPYLEKRKIQVIIIATPEEWKIIQEKNRRFSDLFQVIRMQEPDYPTAVKMVLQQRKYLEIKDACEFTFGAISQLFTVHRNYLKNKALPGSIMKIMNQLAVKYRMSQIDIPEVRDEFQSFSGLQEKIFDPSLAFEQDEVRHSIARELVGQPAAVDTLSDAIHIVKSKLNNPNKPLGSYLFIGPTGVGKTQAAKVLNNYLMGNEMQLMRFDMNEYIDGMAIQRLIGDYYNPEGQLTGKVRYRPFGVLLFDEIEKAHPKVHDLLLQVLDDGRLTDSLGRTVDFSNTIIIMTSNIGAKAVAAQLGFETQSRDESAIYRKAVEDHFRPEFINRIDRIVIFNPLDLQHILSIARLQIKELLKRDGFVRRTTILNISQNALEWVARRGYNARMGGRALKRQIERDLTALSAEQLIASPSDHPILMNIVLEEDRLLPQITPLEFASPLPSEWLPQLPHESKGKGFYNKLIRKVESLERKIRRMEDDSYSSDEELIVIGSEKGQNLDWQYYDFKEKVAQTKQKVTHLSLGFRDKYFRDGPAIPLRLKGSTLYPRNQAFKVVKENIRDRLFQKEALQEISELYEYASSQFDSMQTEFIDSYLDVAFLQLFAKGFLSEKADKIRLRFKSYITGMGKEEIAFLIKNYEQF